MQDCWRKRPDLRPDYQSIIDRLNGQEVTYDHPVQWPFNQRCDTALYQNVRLQSNGMVITEVIFFPHVIFLT